MKTSSLLVVLAVAGAGALGLWHVRRAPREAAPHPLATTSQPRPVQVAAATVPAMDIDAVAPPRTAPDAVERSIAAANGADAGKRAAAITALADAPKAQALPVLRRILENGEPTDRPLALQSLRELALAQGDADGAIRAVVREVIYHGDDQTATDQAQETLDVIEESEMR